MKFFSNQNNLKHTYIEQTSLVVATHKFTQYKTIHIYGIESVNVDAET